MLSLTITLHQQQYGVRRRCTLRFASSSVNTSQPLSPLLMDFSGFRRWLPWKGYLVTSHQSGSNPTRRRVDTSRVGLPSLWCRPHTGVSYVHGCLHKKSVCRDRNGKTGLDWRCSGKRSTHQINPPPPTNNPPHPWIWSKRRQTKNTQGPTTAQGPPQGMHTGTREQTVPDQATPNGDRVNLSPVDVDITDAH